MLFPILTQWFVLKPLDSARMLPVSSSNTMWLWLAPLKIYFKTYLSGNMDINVLDPEDLCVRTRHTSGTRDQGGVSAGVSD